MGDNVKDIPYNDDENTDISDNGSDNGSDDVNSDSGYYSGGSKEGNDDSDDDNDVPPENTAVVRDEIDVNNNDVENEENDVEDEEDEDEDEELIHEEEQKNNEGLGGIEQDEDEDEDDEEHESFYLQKFNSEMNKNYIIDYHPECSINNYSEVLNLSKVVRDSKNNIIDDLHRTLPYLTKYEKTRILGQRAKQINSGAKVFVKVDENIIDGYLVAEMELAQKRIPFIIRRPIPGGKSEYWNVRDLEIIHF